MLQLQQEAAAGTSKLVTHSSQALQQASALGGQMGFKLEMPGQSSKLFTKFRYLLVHSRPEHGKDL